MATEFILPFSTFLTTPINTLPSEILLDIFELASTSLWATSPADSHRSAFTLSHVCQRWRTIMINHTFMWSRIHIGDGLGERCRAMESFRRLEKHRLESLDSYPFVAVQDPSTSPLLDIDIECNDGNKYVAGVGLRQHLQHVRTLRLCSTVEPMLVIVRFSSKDAAPVLEELSICPRPGSIRWGTTRAGVNLDDLFQNETPRLRKVDLTLVHLHWPRNLLRNLQSLTIRWALFGDWPGLWSLLDAMAASPELEELHLLCPPDALHPAYPDFGPSQDFFSDLAQDHTKADTMLVTLPRFKVLTLENAFIATLSQLIPFFDVPDFQELSLIATDDQSDVHWGKLEACSVLENVRSVRITGQGFETEKAAAKLAALVQRMEKLDVLKLQVGAGRELLLYYMRELEDTTKWAQ